MGGPTRFYIHTSLLSWALPVGLHFQLGRGHSSASFQLLCVCLVFSWGPDFKRMAAEDARGAM